MDQRLQNIFTNILVYFKDDCGRSFGIAIFVWQVAKPCRKIELESNMIPSLYVDEKFIVTNSPALIGDKFNIFRLSVSNQRCVWISMFDALEETCYSCIKMVHNKASVGKNTEFS